MKLLFLLALLATAAPLHDDDFPTLSDQILWQSESKVCHDFDFECVGISRMSTRCCKLQLDVI